MGAASSPPAAPPRARGSEFKFKTLPVVPPANIGRGHTRAQYVADSRARREGPGARRLGGAAPRARPRRQHK